MDGTWKDVGTLDKEVTNLAINDTITEVKLTFNGSDPTPVIYEIIASEQSEEPGDEDKLDTSILENEIALVSEIVANIDDYVPSTVEGLADKLAAAQNVLDTATTQEEIDEATMTLREARLNVQKLADKSKLFETLSLYSGYSENDYTPATWTAFYAAYQAAADVYGDVEATQDEVDAAIEALKSAAEALIKAPQTQKPSGDDQVTQKPSQPSGNVDTTDTAAAVQTGLFAGVLAAAAGALLAIRRRMNRE